MKKSSQYFTLLIIFMLLLISSSKLNASLLETKQYGVKESSTRNEASSLDHKLEGSESIYELMGLEKCDDIIDNEECLKRRLISEAHLDYIYTQNYKP